VTGDRTPITNQLIREAIARTKREIAEATRTAKRAAREIERGEKLLKQLLIGQSQKARPANDAPQSRLRD
jgi:alkylation response protein AidB-like acyl-CoA dehydrogenase